MGVNATRSLVIELPLIRPNQTKRQWNVHFPRLPNAHAHQTPDLIKTQHVTANIRNMWECRMSLIESNFQRSIIPVKLFFWINRPERKKLDPDNRCLVAERTSISFTLFVVSLFRQGTTQSPNCCLNHHWVDAGLCHFDRRHNSDRNWFDCFQLPIGNCQSKIGFWIVLLITSWTGN